MRPDNNMRKVARAAKVAQFAAVMLLGAGQALAAEPMANACPVDGCEVRILGVFPQHPYRWETGDDEDRDDAE